MICVICSQDDTVRMLEVLLSCLITLQNVGLQILPSLFVVTVHGEDRTSGKSDHRFGSSMAHNEMEGRDLIVIEIR